MMVVVVEMMVVVMVEVVVEAVELSGPGMADSLQVTGRLIQVIWRGWR